MPTTGRCTSTPTGSSATPSVPPASRCPSSTSASSPTRRPPDGALTEMSTAIVHRLALVACLALAMGLAGAGASAQPVVLPGQPPPPPAPAPAPVGPLDELGRGTPRGTVHGFIEATSARDYARAAGYLNIRRLLGAQAVEQGPDLARKLRVVLDHQPIDTDAVTDEAEGRPQAGMPRGRQLVGRVTTGAQTVSITLERVPRDDGVPIWQFSADTVTRIPDLYWAFSYGVVGHWLPPVFVESRLLGVALWQWIGLVVLIAVSIGLAMAIVRPGLPATRWLLARWGLADHEATLGRSTSPLRGLLALAIFRAGRTALFLPLSALPVVSTIE